MSEIVLSNEQLESIESLRSLKGKKRKQAVVDLIEQGAEGFQVLDFLLDDEDKAIRKLSIEALDCFGETPPYEVYASLEKALDDQESSVRGAVLKKLEVFEPKGSIVPKLTSILATKKARDILVSYGSLAVPTLIHTLENGDKKERKHAIGILSEMGTDADAAIDAIVDLMGDSDTSVRKAVFAAIQVLGVDKERYRDGVLEALQMGDKEAAIVAKTWGVDAIDVFESLLASEEPKIRKFGLENMTDLVEYLEEDDDYDAIIAMLDDDNKPSVQKAALRLFAALPFPVEDALEAIDQLYTHPEAAVVLLKFGMDALPTYKDMIRSKSVKDRRCFFDILPDLSEELLVALNESILQMAKQEYSPELIKSVLKMITRDQFEPSEALAAIEHHQDNWDKDVCEQARETVSALGGEARESMWADCRFSTSIIRHMHRLGAHFTSTKELREADSLSDLDKRLSDGMFDFVHGLTFPNTHTFQTFDAYGETHFTFGDTFESSKYGQSDEVMTCYTFARTDYRSLGFGVDDKSDDPRVYVSDWEDEQGQWGFSSLSYFLQRFERPS